MMRAGGAAKRDELVKMFGELSISTAKTRKLTNNEMNIARHGDKGQGESLKDKRANR